KNVNRYKKQYFNPPMSEFEWSKKEYIEKAPTWCSVDLRDGNQSLIIPMSIDEKLEFFDLLVKLGFKEIEVGFPAASETEYNFLRRLIEEDRIPEDVTVQVLTQAREHIIKKTFESLKGCKNAIVHFYNSTSFAQREQVFRKSKEEIIDIAVKGAELIVKLQEEYGSSFRFEYSPESFTGTEPEFALEISNAVLDILKPSPTNKVILNLPVTVEHSLPHIYANQVEYICKNIKYREDVVISLHPHNDRGCAVADTELGLLAGADRVEGTLFGNGERTGNVDIITLGMNMFTHGVDPMLDFSNMPEICELYERVTRMHVYERSPYSGALVFAAFSGSHQDAIAKGMHYHEENNLDTWSVPYLPIDPSDVGRQYETDVIRINSQSGKGGIGYLIEKNYGYTLPKALCEDVSYFIKGVSDIQHRELMINEVYAQFKEHYVNINSPVEYVDAHFSRLEEEKFNAVLTVIIDGETKVLSAEGNGRLDAVSNALCKEINIDIADLVYEQHALERGSTSKAVSYVGITDKQGKTEWGVGIHNDIITSSIKALFAAVNRVANGE
ncbi:MAG: 2-isopropylmalate synthase, partial [Clostridia bacterium]|nr:2-isopropylmalate synthase [Clostridia bacterium]